MLFDYQGHTYRIAFEHRKKRGRRSTHCYITMKASLDDGVEPDFLPVTDAAARCRKPDNFSREIGRKTALTNALVPMVKPFRTAAWQAYFEQCGPRRRTALDNEV